MTVTVIHDDPRGDLTVPLPDGTLIRAPRGVTVDVPADVAGRPPGDWVAEPGPADDGRSWRLRPDGTWEARDLGSGLLASEHWTIPAAPPAARKPKPTED